jgi:ribonuclease HI
MPRHERAAAQPAGSLLHDLQTVLTTLRIQQWDVIIAGDGSGTGWNDACGWAHIVIDRVSRDRKLLVGGCEGGSINMAEMMPILHGLTWYHQAHGKSLLHSMGRLVVHVITDSEVTAHHGAIAADLTQPLAKVNPLFWSGVREFCRMGYELHFHWLPRCTTGLNQCADLIASLGRKAVKQADLKQLDDKQLQQIQRAQQLGQRILAGAPIDIQVVNRMAVALDTLLKLVGTPADRVAQAMERIQLVDPVNGQPIDLQTITPDAQI